ncbi:MAG TPA: CDP-alcohol phosphatidyltransferase family protein [Polyangiaceae bacterium]|nr:CDP-alcohol phosphatidyltransferase family protein [Polyangiaceae bacterium]
MAWLVRLLPWLGDESTFPPERKVCGLTLALRIALAAQAGGACAVELSPKVAFLLPLLEDPRLRIPVRMADENSNVALRVDMPWNLVIHRDLLKDLASSGATGIRNLFEQPHAFHPPFGFEPIVVSDRNSKLRAERALLRSLRKVQDGWTSTYLNRYISLFITRWLTAIPIRPNQLSLAILGVGLCGAYLASRGTYGAMLLGALLFQAQSVLDGCDGELSRVTYRGSHLGEWLDTIGDDLTNYGFFAGLAWGLHSVSGSWWYLAAGAVVVGCGVITSTIEYRYLIRIGSGDLLKYPHGIGKAPGADAKEAKRKGIVDAISPLFKRDSFVLLTLVGTAVGLAGPFLFVFAAGGIGIFVAVLQAEFRMAKERKMR